jgi:2-polyprenyl-3-methyl-5-hydroxy-6-metoxy-1,4-benzoquinol methylase
LFLALDLGDSPLANRLPDSKEAQLRKFPLQLRVCSDCGLGQVGEFESPEEIFSDYPYLSSTSETWLEANEEFTHEIINSQSLLPGDLILELASNDGYLLKFFQASGFEVLGVEPAQNVADIATLDGVPTIAEFFGLSLAKRLVLEYATPKVIVAKNVVAHVPDLQDFVAGIAELAGPETLIVVEAPTIEQIIGGLQFDTIYHEHFSYLSATSLSFIFASKGLQVIGAEKVGTHGGSFRFFAKKLGGVVTANPLHSLVLADLIEQEFGIGIRDPKTWIELAGRVNECLNSFRDWLTSTSPGVKTVAYGAAAKGVTLLAATNIQPGLIDYVIDNSPAKSGKYMPVADVLILNEIEFVSTRPEGVYRYVILPWNLSDELLPRIRKFDTHAEVVKAIPNLKRFE